MRMLADNMGTPPLLICWMLCCSCGACEEQRTGGGAGAEAPRQPSCGSGQQADAGRAARVRALLANVQAGRKLWARSPRGLNICFIDEGIPSLSTDGVITLDRRASEAENAARLGHLLLHAAEGPPLPNRIPASRSCAEVVRQALGAEARAHALELTLRRQLGVPARRGHAFEGAFWAAPAPRRVELLRAHFQAHPHGGPGLPGYVTAYTLRCEEQKRAAREAP